MIEGLPVASEDALYDFGQELEALKALRAAVEVAQTEPRGAATYPEIPAQPSQEWTALSSVTVMHPNTGVQTTIDSYQQSTYPCDMLTEVSRTDDLRRVTIQDGEARYVRLSHGVGKGALRHLSAAEQQVLARFIEESR